LVVIAAWEGCSIGGKTGVIVGDIQGDFTEWGKGSLAVPNTGSDYVKKAEEVTKMLYTSGLPIFGIQDWHPGDHISFYTSHPGKKPFETVEIAGRRQVLWPPHCVQGTENARILVDNTCSGPSSRREGIDNTTAIRLFRMTGDTRRRWSPF
jgi:nicotinamidase-related amidase